MVTNYLITEKQSEYFKRDHNEYDKLIELDYASMFCGLFYFQSLMKSCCFIHTVLTVFLVSVCLVASSSEANNYQK